MAIYPKDLLRLKKEERRMLRIEKRNNELGATERAKGTRYAILVGTESNLVGSELSSTSAALMSTSLFFFCRNNGSSEDPFELLRLKLALLSGAAVAV